jgi:hypothetical protein
MNLQYLTLPAIQHTHTLPARLPADDLVTSCWERELLQFILRHYVPKNADKFRCLSIGDTQDEIYTTLQQIKTVDSRLDNSPTHWIKEASWELFMALNLNSEEVEMLNEKYNTQKKVRFFRHDYRQGLGIFKHEAAFDWYWLGIEATQQCSESQLAFLLANVLQHAQPHSIIALDLVGKHNVAHLDEVKGWDWDMVENLLGILPVQGGMRVKALKKIDRSVWLHQPLRDVVQDLFKPFVRTPLESLLLSPTALPAHTTEEVKVFFAELTYCWNTLVRYTIERFAGNHTPPEEMQDWVEMPTALKYSLKSTEQIIQDMEWVAYGDVRANVLEPHLGYALRHLEYELQKGLGAGQYFTVLLQIQS